MDFKAFVSLVVIILTFAGYIPYIRDTFRGKTHPHVYTWLAVSLTAGVAYGLQVLGGAGVGAWPMLVVTIVCTVVFVLSLWKGTKNIKLIDLVFLALSLTGLGLWTLAHQPLTAVVLITAAEVLAFVPTIRKSWSMPHSETLSLYEVSALRHGLSILALEKINLLTALYPAAWTLTNIVITCVLIERRKSKRQLSDHAT